MNRILPNRPGRLLALLGSFLVATVLGWSANSRVWVQYAPGAKGQVMAALAKAGGHVHYEFDNIEAVAVSMPEQALAGLSHNPHVLLVEADPIRVMSSESIPYGIDMVQAPLAVADGGTGVGMTVGIIDSGVYTAHEDLPPGKITGYPNGTASNPEIAWNRDYLSHGTHVTGTIAAIGGNGKGVVGVAPGIDHIFMFKVFGDTGNWIYSSSLLAAVQYTVTTGHAKIVSMSLGGAGKSKTEERGLNSIYNKGTLLVAAAGNDGNSTTSYPAGYSSVISVAAVDSGGAHADFSQTNNTVELSAPGVGVLSTTSYIDTTTLSVGGTGFTTHHVEYSGRGVATGPLVDGGNGTTVGSWGGKVVLVHRGATDFNTMVQNVQNGNGVACIIANNVAGELNATLGIGNSSTIPAVSVTLADGNTIAGVTGSSVTVSSTFQQPASGYEAWDGTSMATPHVSGVAALVWSKYPGATNKQVRQALDDSAMNLGAPGRDNSYGYGLVQADDALVRLGELTGGSPPPPPPPPADFAITDYGATGAKGKPGPFTVSFTTNAVSTGTIAVSGFATVSVPSGTSHSADFQGSKGVTYSITVSAAESGGSGSDSKTFTFRH